MKNVKPVFLWRTLKVEDGYRWQVYRLPYKIGSLLIPFEVLEEGLVITRQAATYHAKKNFKLIKDGT